MKLPLMPKKKLRATAARRAPSRAIEEQEEEPTVRLSSAFLIVLLLHFVAIGGIYTFESIKVHRRGEEPASKPAQPTTAATQAAAATTAAVSTPAAASNAKQPATDLLAATVRSTDAEASKKASTSAARPAAPARESNTVHVVVKGENPRSIARKYKVNYEELLRVNKITDPTKLQIGQKLVIPKS